MSDFKLTFLGTGTSQGIPVIACDCLVCTSTDLRDKRSRCSVYIETPESSFVVDTGPDFRTQALREKIRKMDAAVFTHGHTDHIMGFDDLRPFCWDMTELNVFGSPETMDILKRCFAFAFDNEHRYRGYILPIPHAVSGTFTIGETQITPVELPHGRLSSTGFIFSRHGKQLAAYLNDCKMVPEAVIERIRGIPVVILDALRREPHPTHMSVQEALEVASKINPGQAWLTHLSHDLSHRETEHALPAHVGVAYDGLQIVL